ncbi:MAG: putative toxin-antitoxin system toxin component, PIN family [Acidobacteria bacterium]|nr:putative toxin-antitoxin system toxin component, PIN family [Acidobacteriota bacterium]
MRGVTFDSNIYISALVFGGECGRLVRMARAREFQLVVSEVILREVITVLREDFHWEPYRLQDARQRMLSIARVVMPALTIQVIGEDPDDDRILECAVAGESEFLITRDKDLLRLVTYEGIMIVTPTQFLTQFMEP